MQDFAMYIMELVQNSIVAGAKKIQIIFEESIQSNQILIQVKDDGKGMDEKQSESATSPFHTSRKTRKIGMGLAFLKGLADLLKGTLEIDSKPGIGTTILATFPQNSIDTPEWGDFGEMMMEGIQADSTIEYHLKIQTDLGEFLLDSSELKKQCAPMELSDPKILLWIRDYVNENVSALKEGQK